MVCRPCPPRSCYWKALWSRPQPGRQPKSAPAWYIPCWKITARRRYGTLGPSTKGTLGDTSFCFTSCPCTCCFFLSNNTVRGGYYRPKVPRSDVPRRGHCRPKCPTRLPINWQHRFLSLFRAHLGRLLVGFRQRSKKTRGEKPRARTHIVLPRSGVPAGRHYRPKVPRTSVPRRGYCRLKCPTWFPTG